MRISFSYYIENKKHIYNFQFSWSATQGIGHWASGYQAAYIIMNQFDHLDLPSLEWKKIRKTIKKKEINHFFCKLAPFISLSWIQKGLLLCNSKVYELFIVNFTIKSRRHGILLQNFQP